MSHCKGAVSEARLTIPDLVARAHATAVDKGWWDTKREVPECLALIHSEVSEALEAYRGPAPVQRVEMSASGKPEGFPVELADAVIRIADLCGRLGIDLEAALLAKLVYNGRRDYRHGNKRA